MGDSREKQEKIERNRERQEKIGKDKKKLEETIKDQEETGKGWQGTVKKKLKD